MNGLKHCLKKAKSSFIAYQSQFVGQTMQRDVKLLLKSQAPIKVCFFSTKNNIDFKASQTLNNCNNTRQYI